MIDNIYNKYLSDSLSKVFGREFDITSWKNKVSEYRCYKDGFDIGYIGGGNALLLFKEKTTAEEFIQELTKSLLIHTPGIMTAVALNKLDLDNKNFLKSKEELFAILKENKRKYLPVTLIPGHGITSECTHSGFSMDKFNSIEKQYVSAGTHAKIEASKNAKKDIHNKYKDELKDEFCFTDQLNKVGQIRGADSHIAIVHIDGNNIGDRFKNMDSLEKTRDLSKTMGKATEEAFSDLLRYIVDNYEKIMECLGFDNSSEDERLRFPVSEKFKKKILPIRPIIIGGDDITFVSDGKLGIYFSKLFIEAFEQKKVSDGEKLTACAGIAIIKTKYPFYRGYLLAEELCRNAKRERIARKDMHSSYIDFHISTGGLAGALDLIRKKYFKVSQGNLLFRPYVLAPKDGDEQSFDLLLDKTGELKDFPKNKIAELRQVLTLSKEATEQFVQEMKYRGRKFPEIPGRGYEVALFEHKKTPYFDMIELLEYYPLDLHRDGDRA
ncbi:MAG TPA: hypothetical protein ENG83_07475 [Nitrospirae bacterium]|nr:hypothetical protein [Nitrospirota bacterium]